MTGALEPGLGLEKIAEGREAEIFLLPDGRVLRLVRDGMPYADERVGLEAVALAAAAHAGVPVPAVFERQTRDGRPGLVMERLEGRDLLSIVGSRPWLVGSVARQTGRLHAELHRVPGPAALPALGQRVAELIDLSDAVPAELREEALRALAQLPEGDRLCHGDFHPGNVIGGPGRVAIVDWTNATRGDPVADVARSWVVLEFSALPPGSSWIDRRLASVGRGLLLRMYMRAYMSDSKLDAGSLGAWTRVRAIERLTQEIEGEREPLLQRLRR